VTLVTPEEPAVRSASLLAIRGPLTGMRLDISSDRFVIGRGTECDLVLEDAMTSRAHAAISRVRLGWTIEDLKSRHGTKLNSRVLDAPRSLGPNDEIEVGGSLFLFDSEFDLQNAEFTDRSVYFAGAGDETLDVNAARGVTQPGEPRGEVPVDSLDLIVDLGRILESESVPFGEALHNAIERLARLFRSDVAMLMLWDTAAGTLRPAAVIAEGDVLADSVVLRRVHNERRALLLSDRPNLASHPAPGAPGAPSMRSLAAAPVMSEGEALGVLSIERFELDAYSLKDLRILQAVGSLLGVFIEARQRMEAQLLRLNFVKLDSPLVGNSPAFRRMMEFIQRLAPTPSTVLLTGETGTGKELLAREVHRLSKEGAADGPFVAVNCAAIPETLFESELFGHEKGSFTGAVRQQRGLIEQANGGTLFLDEIGELSMAMQPKLLRFLQEKTFQRVGGNRPLRAQVRLVCATNRDLAAEVTKARFREDLYHRIAVLPVQVPPLRERRPDIRGLAEHFMRVHSKSIGRIIAGISDDAMIALEKYAWPGNIRELSNCIERAILLCEDKVLLPRHFHLSGRLAEPTAAPPAPIARTTPAPNPLRPLAEVERDHILAVLAACDGNQVKASDVLGIHRNTMRKKLEEYGGNS